MNRRIQFLVALFTLCLFLCAACDVTVTTHQINRFSKTAIVFPDSLELFFNGQSSFVSFYGKEGLNPRRQVILIDSLECSLCRIQKVSQYEDLFLESIMDRKFDLIIILSPSKMETSLLRDFLLNHNLKVPVYLDSNNGFYSKNYLLQTNRHFHAFLLDNSGFPVFIGDPSRGGKLYELFKQSINL